MKKFIVATLLCISSMHLSALDCHEEFYKHYQALKKAQKSYVVFSFTLVTIPLAVRSHHHKVLFKHTAQLLNESFYRKKDLSHTKYLSPTHKELQKSIPDLTREQLQQALRYIDSKRVLFCKAQKTRAGYPEKLSEPQIIKDLEKFFQTDVGEEILAGKIVVPPYFPREWVEETDSGL